MDHEEEQREPDPVATRLQEDGLPPDASAEERQRHLFQQLVGSEEKLQSAAQELESLRSHQAFENEEMKSYTEHIRGLLEKREGLIEENKRENEQMQHELQKMRQQQESQNKELAEMLAQEGLEEIVLSSPCEQMTYLLMERATLMERLVDVERILKSQSRSEATSAQAHGEEITRVRNERQRFEQDLEEASKRLAMAQQDIRRLTYELDAAKNNSQDQTDKRILQQAQGKNDRLNVENQTLKERVQSLESENEHLLLKMVRNDADQSSVSKEDPEELRTHTMIEDGLVQVRKLQRQLQKLEEAKEEVEERNEELEALLGKAEDSSKVERNRYEGDLEGLFRRINGLEAELKKQQDAEEKISSNNKEDKQSFSQLHQSDSSQERMALLEARLMEEKDWRKQLEVDLDVAQAALKRDKEALKVGELELKKLKLEAGSLRTECQQGKTLIKSLTQVKGGKAILEEKMECDQRRMQREVEQYKDFNRTEEHLTENRPLLDQQQEQAERQKIEFSNLRTAHSSFRPELTSEQQQTAELQAKMSSIEHEKRLAQEILHLKDQLKWLQEQLLTKEELISSQTPEVNTVGIDSRLNQVDWSNEGCINQLACIRQIIAQLVTKLGRERQAASQNQLALRAQVNVAQEYIKSQDLVLSQTSEEAKHMKQGMHRAQSLFTSAERELRHEKEMSCDLSKHKLLLEQENFKLRADLNQVHNKLSHVEKSLRSQEIECAQQQQKIRDLEMELARNATIRSNTIKLQEDVQQERVKVNAANKKMGELQQQLNSVLQQLRVEEARTNESMRLERANLDLSETLSTLRAKQQEEQISRKLLQQREIELQQQMQSLKLNETALTKNNTDLNHRAQKLDARLSILENELSNAREEVREGQKSNHRLQEDLLTCQQECKRKGEELQHVLQQLDTHIRKYNEKKCRDKTKLHKTKQLLLKKVAQKDDMIQKLEKGLNLASTLSQKDRERIKAMTEENEKLLKEKRELLKIRQMKCPTSA